MYGAIMGNIAGSLFETDGGPKTKDFPFLAEGSHFTGDTVMSIAVAEALMDSMGKGEAEHKAALIASMQKWGRKYPHAGYSRNFRAWLRDRDPRPYNSWGNGSAMRVPSVGWLYDTMEETLEKARWTAEVTHNHPEGIRGAQAVAAATYLARTKRTMDEIREYITSHFFYDLNRTCDEIRPAYRLDASCQGSVPEAIIAFLESTEVIDAVKNAVSLGGDTDTIACIAGGIAEAFWGIGPMAAAHVERKLKPDMLDVLERFCGMRNICAKNWMRKVAKGEADGGEKLSAESAKAVVFRWDRCQEVLLALKKGYETGDFSDVEKYLTDESILESQRVWTPLTGKDDIMAYLTRKGETLIKKNHLAEAEIPAGLEGEYLYVHNGNDAMGVQIRLDDKGFVARIDLVLP